MGLDSFIKTLKDTPWEEKTYSEIEQKRLTIAVLKATSVLASPILRRFLRSQLEDHAKDELAKRLFDHYLYESGKQYMLTFDDMKHMPTDACKLGHIDLRAASYTNPATRSEWTEACRRAKATGKEQDYSGKLLWAWDNGAIANYTVILTGKVYALGSQCRWGGLISYYDKFDLDPRWGWSPANPQGRSRGGERRTRIGYMLDLGWDYEIKSPQAIVSQGETDAELSFTAPVPSVTSGGSSGDI